MHTSRRFADRQHDARGHVPQQRRISHITRTDFSRLRRGDRYHLQSRANQACCWDARQRGIRHASTGCPMLVAQAKYAAELFTGRPIDDARSRRDYRTHRRQTKNILLIGMPSSGKSTDRQSAGGADGTGPFLDTDAIIELSRRGEASPISSGRRRGGVPQRWKPRRLRKFPNRAAP